MTFWIIVINEQQKDWRLPNQQKLPFNTDPDREAHAFDNA